jgi:hypothetical protein
MYGHSLHAILSLGRGQHTAGPSSPKRMSLKTLWHLQCSPLIPQPVALCPVCHSACHPGERAPAPRSAPGMHSIKNALQFTVCVGTILQRHGAFVLATEVTLTFFHWLH